VFAYTFGDKDWVIENLKSGERVFLPSQTLHMLVEHGFGQGLSSKFRVDPEQWVRVLRGRR
jgi:hypothetical protein